MAHAGGTDYRSAPVFRFGSSTVECWIGGSYSFFPLTKLTITRTMEKETKASAPNGIRIVGSLGKMLR